MDLSYLNSDEYKLNLLYEEMSNIKILTDKITNIYMEELFSMSEEILNLPEIQFLNIFLNKMKLILDDNYSEKCLENENFYNLINKIEGRIFKKYYISTIELVNEALNNTQFSKNLPIFDNFIKHCIYCDDSGYHVCGNKLIPIYDNNKIRNVICLHCNAIYFINYIKMWCNHCKKIYQSSYLENKSLQPATWHRYHCRLILNDQMKCIMCRSFFFINVENNKLFCNDCKFEIDPMNINWICIQCNEEFKTGAKIYNFSEFKAIKFAIRDSIINKVLIKPIEIPCCKINPLKYNFFHNKNCSGKLYFGKLNNRNLVVCGRCKTMTQSDLFQWMCPLCNNLFRSKRVYNTDSCLNTAEDSSIYMNEFDEQYKNLYNKKVTNKYINSYKDINLIQNINDGEIIIPKTSSLKLRFSLSISFKTYESCRDNIHNNKKFESINDNDLEFEEDNQTEKISSFIYNSDNSETNQNVLKTNIITNFIKNSLLTNHDIFKKSKSMNNLLDVNQFLNSNESHIKQFNCDDFKFLSLIGEGSFGKIYLVEDNNMNKFSMKKIFANDLNELEFFYKEYELVNNNQHNNIMKILGISKKKLDNTTYVLYILMELALLDWEKEIKQRNLLKKYYKEFELIDILKQLTNALCFLQTKEISHRDIKPQNILLFENNIYKLADFGEAKKLSKIESEKGMLTMRGTEMYMSPALYNSLRSNYGEIKHNTYKSDVFSLAYCLLYASTLEIKILYQFRNISDYKSLPVILKKLLSSRYSSKFINLMSKMLENDENGRFDFLDLKYFLDNY